MSIVVCKLPKAGLGNQLFPLMNAYVFAELNKFKVIVIGYHYLKPGPYLRNEKTKRRYNGYFTFQKNLVGEALDILKIKSLLKTGTCIYEPKIEKLNSTKEEKVFVFAAMSNYHDYFVQLKPYRKLVIELLFKIITPKILRKLEQNHTPVIGVHIRMGDFRKLKEGEIYQSGHVRVPVRFFIDTIKEIRKINGKENPVSVFTDGYQNELQELLQLNHIKIIDSNPDIVDLLLLSKSQLIIGTHGSTFSAWAGFLSNASMITTFPHQKPLREASLYTKIYEGPFDMQNDLLISNIKCLNG